MLHLFVGSPQKKKIFIFGKSSLGIAEVIRSSLSVDVSRYSENSELFVCIDKCYQRLIKFNRASHKLKELKTIKSKKSSRQEKMVFDLFLYSVTVQAKNIHPDENADKGVKNTSTSSPRGKASKCDLPIPLVLLLSSTKIRMRREHPFCADRTPLGFCLSLIQSHPFGLVLRAFPNAQLNGSSPLPMLTSTPEGWWCDQTQVEALDK